MTPIRNLTGKRFGRLLVLSINGRTRTMQVKWLCRCDCGNQKTVTGNSLTSGNTLSCGCIKREQIAERNRKGADPDKKTRLYRIWNRMNYRCMNPNSSDYYRYGGKGITVFSDWKNSFQQFKEWSYLNGYNDNLSIDRIDPNGNYEPQNCRWATDKTQARNKTNNRLITYKGNTKTLSEWAEIHNIDRSKLKYRLNKNWPFEKAINQQS